MSALVAAASCGDVTEVQRLLKEGALGSELDEEVKSALLAAVFQGRSPVVKSFIKEGGADINTVITPGGPEHTVLSVCANFGRYSLVQWLLEEGATSLTSIWEDLKNTSLKHPDAAELSSMLKVLILLLMSSAHDCYLPAFVAELSPRHAELCTRGHRLRALLPMYLEQQWVSLHTHCFLPTVLHAMVITYALPTTEDTRSDGLQLLELANISNESSTAPKPSSRQ
jgi:hypothetical protein